MSKKDYQALAGAIFATRVPADANHGHADAMRSQWTCTREFIADVLAADSPRFDRARFIEACETGKTKGMRQVGAS